MGLCAMRSLIRYMVQHGEDGIHLMEFPAAMGEADIRGTRTTPETLCELPEYCRS